MDSDLELVVPEPYNLYGREEVSEVCKQASVEEVYPVSGVDTGVIQFQVNGTPESCIVPMQTYMKLSLEISGRAKRTPADKSVPGYELEIGAPKTEGVEEVKIWPVNNIFDSMFESVVVEVENQPTTKADRHNAHIAYFEKLLSCGFADKQYHMTELTGWGKDTLGNMDSLEADKNTGLTERMSCWYRQGNVLKGSFVGRLSSPVFTQTKILPTQIGLRVTLRRAPDAFCLMHEDGDFKLRVTQAILVVKRVVLEPAAKESQLRLLSEDANMKVYWNAPAVNYYTIEKGSSQFVREDLFNGRIPRDALMCMVRTGAYHGDHKLNPFNLEHMGISEITLHKDGMPFPYPPIPMDFTTSKPVLAYHYSMRSLGPANNEKPPPITLEEYMQGFTFFRYDFSPDQLGFLSRSMLSNTNSNMRLEMKFKKPLAENITLLVYYTTASCMEIAKGRKVIMHY